MFYAILHGILYSDKYIAKVVPIFYKYSNYMECNKK